MCTSRRIVLAIALSISAVAAASAQTGSIGGTITTATTVTPSITVFDSSGRQAGTATGASYTVSGLAPGTYYVTASAPGYVRELYNDIPCVAADCVPTGGTPVTVTASTTSTANFTLTSGGGIRGTVRRASDATAVTAVTVFLYNASTSLVTSTVTASDGSYAFSALPAGNYFLRVGAPTSSTVAPDYIQELYGGVLCPVIGTSSFACRITQGTPVTVIDGADASGVDFSLDHGGRINGQVISGGAGVAGVTVTAYIGTTTPLGVAAVTDAGGFYTVVGLPTGNYFVRATPTGNLIETWFNGVSVASGFTPTAVPVTAGLAATGINIGLQGGGAISGTVTFTDPGAGTLAAQAPPSIEVYNASNTLVKTKNLPVSGSPIAYTVDGLPGGSYYVKVASTAADVGHVSPPSGLFVDQLYNHVTCVAQDCLPNSGTPVAVTVGATTPNINFALVTGGSITGAVAAGTFVDIYDSRGILLPRRTFRGVDRRRSLEPRYGATGLPSGVYFLLSRGNDAAGQAPELYRGQACSGCAVTFGTPVVVAAGAARSGIDFTGIAAGAIAGTVTDNAPAPLSTITVEVYASDGALAGTATTTATGAFRIGGLAPGTYYARTVNTRGYVDEIYDNMPCASCSVLTGTAITVAASATTTANFALGAGVAVGGTVRTDLGAPLAGTGVSLFTSTGTQVARATVNELGVYAATLAPGSYRARTDPKPGYVQELFNNTPCANGTCDVTTGTAITVAATPVTNVDFGLAVCSPRIISPTRLASAAVGASYRQTLAATGATNRRFAIISGTLPPGLAVDNATGVISGTPTASGSFSLTVAVTDAFGCVGTIDFVLDVPACAFNLDATTISLGAAGGPVTINITNACGAATATSNDSFITVTGSSSTGVQLAVAASTSATPRTGSVTIGPRVFTVFQSGTTAAPPFGVVDTPVEGSTAAGSIAVTGWALDNVGVNQVQIYRDPVAGEAAGVPVFIGIATFVAGARPDVEAAYPDVPANNRAGWGYLLLTNMLPSGGNGTFRLLMFAQDTDGTTTLLGTRTIVGQNSTSTQPFGAIDTPAQGATISGSSYTNFGWALTPQPKLIPFGGSGVTVFIDGASIGTLTQFNLFRSDVSNLFPNLKNSGGPIGFKTIDTTALTEGVHTISWVAVDDAFKATGIGSRYFTVNNSAWTASLTQPSDAALEQEATVVPPRIAGPDLGRRSANLSLLPAADAEVSLRRDQDGGDPQIVEASESGGRTVTVKELERVELELGTAGVCNASFHGYTVALGEIRDLPIGASLDAAGRFYWQTTPGFIGSYRFVFVRTACDGTRDRIPVTIRIEPR